ncbi:uncharacterized protein METZ01_LOCUS274456, partial [marine metagenome]
MTFCKHAKQLVHHRCGNEGSGPRGIPWRCNLDDIGPDHGKSVELPNKGENFPARKSTCLRG